MHFKSLLLRFDSVSYRMGDLSACLEAMNDSSPSSCISTIPAPCNNYLLTLTEKYSVWSDTSVVIVAEVVIRFCLKSQ
jgi:hypothetical protein